MNFLWKEIPRLLFTVLCASTLPLRSVPNVCHRHKALPLHQPESVRVVRPSLPFKKDFLCYCYSVTFLWRNKEFRLRNSRARARLRQQTFPLGAKRASPGGFLCHGNEVSYDTKKQKSPDLATSASHVYLRHPYVGIIQIRLSVEGHTFLSARHTSSRLFYCRILS